MTGCAFIASTIAFRRRRTSGSTSSTPCAASRRRWRDRCIVTACFRARNTPFRRRRTLGSTAWAALSAALPRRDACRRMVDLLWLAHDEGCETELATLIAGSLGQGELPEARALQERLEPRLQGRGHRARRPVAGQERRRARNLGLGPLVQRQAPLRPARIYLTRNGRKELLQRRTHG